MEMIKAVIFDLDDTLVSTKKVEHLRTSSHHDELIANLSNVKLYEPTVDILENLRANGVKIGIVTNSPSKYAHTILEHFGITHFFDKIICWDDVGYADIKPSPKGIKMVLESFALKPEDGVVYVGDQDTDVIAAYNARVIPISPSWATKNGITVAPAAVLSSTKLIQDLKDAGDIKYLAELASSNQSFTPQAGEMYNFLPLNIEGEILAADRQDIELVALGRYFSQRSELTASLHSQHSLSKEIYKKEEIPNYSVPRYWVELLVFAVDKLADYMFGVGEQFDIVTVIPSKQEKTPRLEMMLSSIAEQSSQETSFIPDLFYFNAGSHSLKTLGGRDARVAELDANLHLNNKYTGLIGGKRILILDDVITTGSTLKRAFSLLGAFNPQRILGCCLAKTVRVTQDYKACPQCGRTMSVKMNKSNKIPFWGCSGFHEQIDQCKFVESIYVKDCPNCGKGLRRMYISGQYTLGHDFRAQGRECTYNEPA